MQDAGGDRWVFGYGSLMWRPGFAFIERRTAVLHGRRRAFCIYSVHHRGTYERPGLVLGLAPGGSVRGAAYRVADADWPEVYAYLRDLVMHLHEDGVRDHGMERLLAMVEEREGES